MSPSSMWSGDFFLYCFSWPLTYIMPWNTHRSIIQHEGEGARFQCVAFDGVGKNLVHGYWGWKILSVINFRICIDIPPINNDLCPSRNVQWNVLGVVFCSSVCLFVWLPVCPFGRLSVCLPVHLTVCASYHKKIIPQEQFIKFCMVINVDYI